MVVCAMSEALLSFVAAGAKMRSPRIMAFAWGRIEVEGVGRDAKLFPGGAREWDWRETGTKHTPGIQPTDVCELLDHGATTIVLSQGMLKRLGICPETLELLKQQGVGAHVLPTQEAADLRLAQDGAGRGAVPHDLLAVRLATRFRPGAKSIDPMTNMPRITLLSVGNPDRRALDDLARDLGGMGFDVELAARRALPQGAFDAGRGQLHADALLGLALSVGAERVLAVTDVDLYAGNLNFVFGIAQPSGVTPSGSAIAPIRVASCGSAIPWGRPTAKGPPTAPGARRRSTCAVRSEARAAEAHAQETHLTVQNKCGRGSFEIRERRDDILRHSIREVFLLGIGLAIIGNPSDNELLLVEMTTSRQGLAS